MSIIFLYEVNKIYGGLQRLMLKITLNSSASPFPVYLRLEECNQFWLGTVC